MAAGDGYRGHGGPDASGSARWDFSVNVNAAGPPAAVLQRLRSADPRRYPDPQYTGLREQLAGWLGVQPWQVLPGGGGSELVFRLTAWAARRGLRAVHAPRPGWGDYAAAAAAFGLPLRAEPGPGALNWACEPNNPDGAPADPRVLSLAGRADTLVVLDRAYEPLRLAGMPSSLPAGCWQLWTPNKALALPGVRAALLVAPDGARAEAAALDRLAPSWPLGADGVALLMAWTLPEVQRALNDSRCRLARWAGAQRAALERLGWQRLGPGLANFDLWRPALQPDPVALRAQGLRLRDATNLGAPGAWRLAVLPPAAQRALLAALRAGAVLPPHPAGDGVVSGAGSSQAANAPCGGKNPRSGGAWRP